MTTMRNRCLNRIRSSEPWSSFWSEDDALKIIDAVLAELEQLSEGMAVAALNIISDPELKDEYGIIVASAAFTAAIKAAREEK